MSRNTPKLSFCRRFVLSRRMSLATIWLAVGHQARHDDIDVVVVEQHPGRVRSETGAPSAAPAG